MNHFKGNDSSQTKEQASTMNSSETTTSLASKHRTALPSGDTENCGIAI